MTWSAHSNPPTWLLELSALLRRDVDAAASGIIRIEMPTLTALFACSPDQAEQILCEAALHAGLAVGVVQDRFYDVMTTEEACAVLDDWEDEDTERPPH